jgi:sialate O-acetylesterase
MIGFVPMPSLTFLSRVAAIAIAAGLSLNAAVRLPSVLGDHMVVQRGLPVHIWGFADPAESVTATFRGATRSTSADDLGRWSIYLPPGDAGGPFEMGIKGSNEITLHDILAGDVWVASGQSNMEWMVRNVDNAKTEISAAKYPQIRLFHVKNKSSEYQLVDVESDPWVACDPETVSNFSAVAYFFGRDLNAKTRIPIGLISTSWGGTPADAWTSLDAIGADASLMPVFAEWAKMMDGQAPGLLRFQQQLRKWEEDRARAKAEGKPEPQHPWVPNLGMSWRPAGLFNAMIAPLTPFPIRGAIWYQGESNASAERAPLYAHLFQAMIQDWRRAWGTGDFPFYFVQLANFKAGPNNRWPELREAQRETLALANTGMAVTIDIGNPDDIHPRNKQDVGARLARWALANVYGQNVEYSGPLFRQAMPEANGMRVWFDHASGLTVRGGPATGFEIAGPDRKFVPAEARVDGSSVVVSSPQIEHPLYVRYGWSDNPQCNLYNSAGLPASPFRSAD